MYIYIYIRGRGWTKAPDEDGKLLVVADFQQGYRSSRIQPGMKVTRRIASHPAGARLFEISTSIFWPVYPWDGRGGGEHRGAKRTHRSVIRVSESDETVRGRGWIKFGENRVCKNERRKKKEKKKKTGSLRAISILSPRFCGRWWRRCRVIG